MTKYIVDFVEITERAYTVEVEAQDVAGALAAARVEWDGGNADALGSTEIVGSRVFDLNTEADDGTLTPVEFEEGASLELPA